MSTQEETGRVLSGLALPKLGNAEGCVANAQEGTEARETCPITRLIFSAPFSCLIAVQSLLPSWLQPSL